MDLVVTHTQEKSVAGNLSAKPYTCIRRAVVTGAAGFIGSHLTQALLSQGTTVIGVDRRGPTTDRIAASNLAALNGHDGYLHVTADLRACAIDPLLVGADAVFHLAGIPGVRASWGGQFSEYVHTNILATQRLMDCVTRMHVPRLVVASSSSVYGPTPSGVPSVETDQPRPMSPYAVSKLAQEQLCLAHSTRAECPTSVIALRYFTVYGPRQRPDMFIHRALHAAITGQPLHIFGQGHQRRDFTYVDDVVAATIAAAGAPVSAQIINVGGGSDVSLIDIINACTSLTGRRLQVHLEPTCNGDVPTTCADPRRAQSVLGWRPTMDLVSGMQAQLRALTDRLAAA